MLVVESVDFSESSLEGNSIIFDGKKNDVRLINSSILFKGSGNIVFFEGKCTLEQSQLTFFGNNAVVYFSSTSKVNRIKANIFHDSVLFVGENNYFNGIATLSLSERKHILIGRDCMFSYNTSLQTSDVHLVYSAETRERLNPSKSIIVGDHVWIGQGALLLKGSAVGSGSIVGARSVCTKQFSKNCSIAGVPARVIASDIFWNPTSVHAFSSKQTEQWAHGLSGDGIFEPSGQPLTVATLEAELDTLVTAAERLTWCQQLHSLGPKRFAYDAPGAPVRTGVHNAIKCAGQAVRKIFHYKG